MPRLVAHHPPRHCSTTSGRADRLSSMRINGMPAHVARAYGAPPPVKSAQPASATKSAAETRKPESLVAATVPGKVNFQGTIAPTTSPDAFAMYTRSADRVEAAVGVALGRTIDVRG